MLGAASVNASLNSCHEPPPAHGGQPTAANGPAVKEPHDDRGAQKQKPLQAHREQPAEPTSAGTQPGELLRLKLDVLKFVAEDLIAEPPQDRRLRCLLEDGVINLGNDFGGDKDRDGDFQPTKNMP